MTSTVLVLLGSDVTKIHLIWFHWKISIEWVSWMNEKLGVMMSWIHMNIAWHSQDIMSASCDVVTFLWDIHMKIFESLHDISWACMARCHSMPSGCRARFVQASYNFVWSYCKLYHIISLAILNAWKNLKNVGKFCKIVQKSCDIAYCWSWCPSIMQTSFNIPWCFTSII